MSILRPPQITVGLDYVKAKALITARHTGSGRERFMSAHAIHVVMGSVNDAYIVDHHHWARAWLMISDTLTHQ
ncbi:MULTISPECIES: ParB-like protein [Paraburkholderia]|uniref:ParB-like protein n=1 Tax=Paraburkholderia TaxID=1822464 RepID=UPI0038BDDA66